MSKEINLRNFFGDPDEVLQSLGKPEKVLPMGLVPCYRLGDYHEAFKVRGIHPGHVNTQFDERWFPRGLRAIIHTAQEGGLGVFMIHVPRTRYKTFTVQEAFLHAATMFTFDGLQKGGVLPLCVVTRGEAYTHREDNSGVKWKIEEPDYDGTERAIEEAKSMGALPLVLNAESIHKEIQALVGALAEGKMPSSRVA